MNVAGLILAGGLARRMGRGQKALLPLGGRHLIGHVIERLSPQVAPLALNVNAELDQFSELGLHIVSDTVPGFAGPLAGVLAGLEWIRRLSPVPDFLLTAPTDAPFLPDDLCARLAAAAEDEAADIAVASSGERTHPVVALWRPSLSKDLRKALIEDDIRKIDRFTAVHRTVHVDWSLDGGDPFFNINRPEDLEAAETLLG
ncbi:molybdenum cofactor guanylyltransferase MobA [Minwuia sp.]|uniref:molybdenum cofactor guanylyltransferase MobA n=1 Tax=Minwuia sp. TaxID=2493630 RepID=UPI003A9407C1